MVEWGHAHHLGVSSVKHSDSGLCAVTMSISRCSEGNTACQQDSIKRLLCSGGLLNTPRSCPHSHLEPVLFGALGDNVGVKLWMRLTVVVTEGSLAEHLSPQEPVCVIAAPEHGLEKAMAPTPALLPGKSHGRRSLEGCSPWGRWESDTTERLHFHFPLSCIGEGDGTHSSTVTRKIPWTEEPGGLQPMGSPRVGHDWATSLSLSTFMHWRRKWQPTPVFLPGESQGRRSLIGCSPWGRTELDTTEAT